MDIDACVSVLVDSTRCVVGDTQACKRYWAVPFICSRNVQWEWVMSLVRSEVLSSPAVVCRRYAC